jgi:peptidoglycan/xylan/chitin deacetylase (PgdA/CDA1 family)
MRIHRPWSRLATTAVAIGVFATMGTLPVRGATAPTVVTIQFDDGSADQYAALAILNAHAMHATFYVNTGFIGDADHLSWTQLSDLAVNNEIGGHTLHHANVKKLKLGPATTEVCDDRQNIIDHGLGVPTSFAYPFGSIDALAKQVVASCGYTSGRGVSGVNDRRVFGETIPPLDAYATRTPPNPKQGTTLATIEGYVTAAEANGGSWVQLVFHHVCDGCDAYSITPENLSALLDWLSLERAAGRVVVQTTGEVMAP